MQKPADATCFDSSRRANEVLGSRERTKGASSRMLLKASNPSNGIFKPVLITTLSHAGEAVSGTRLSTEYMRTREVALVDLKPFLPALACEKAAFFGSLTGSESESERSTYFEMSLLVLETD